MLILVIVRPKPKKKISFNNSRTWNSIDSLVVELESDEETTPRHTRFRALSEADFLILDHMTTDQYKKLYRQSIKLTISALLKTVNIILV